MHPRYPAPAAQRIFGDEERLDRWTRVSIDYAAARVMTLPLPAHERKDLLDEIYALSPPTPEAVRTREGMYGHDVVAFLSLIEDNLDKAKPHLHRGLTSSDIVDNAHFRGLRTHADQLERLTLALAHKTMRWGNAETYRAGRTHGQIAATTSWNHQMKVYHGLLIRLCQALGKYSVNGIIKSGGPTGYGLLNYDPAPNMVSKRHMGSRVVPSTQVIPRDYQVEWAALYVRLAGVLENLALLVRLGARAEVAEVREGAERVGSSAMPHKRNPIDSEKVCGLARVARGYFATIAEGSALWEDRDLTNSSMERIVVPDLAAVVEHMVLTMSTVIGNLEIDSGQMMESAHSRQARSAIAQMKMQDEFGVGPVRAGTLLREYVDFSAGTYSGIALADILGVPVEAIDRWWDSVN